MSPVQVVVFFVIGQNYLLAFCLLASFAYIFFIEACFNLNTILEILYNINEELLKRNPQAKHIV